jgi:aminomethyltransferase
MLKTPLHDIHVKLGAKMGEFAGYDMPLYYGEGVIKEHEWVRSKAGLFDVSHMGQIIIDGPDEEIIAFWEKLTPSAFATLKDNAAKYTVLNSDKGGMIDDLIITRLWKDKFFAVLNAGRKNVDIEHLKKNLPSSLKLNHAPDEALIALQGPSAEKVMKEVFKIDFSAQNYMSGKYYDLNGVAALISRLGYTGEDGFEISVSAKEAPGIWNKLLGNADVKPIGLAARDSLRLEMGYPLYGHDIDETTSPLEANMNWIVRKSASIPAPKRLRVGIKLLDKGVAREGAEILDGSGKKIGALTSGGFSPSLKESIGMGYVDINTSKDGTKVQVDVRGRKIPAEIVPMPFVKARTKSAKKKEAA